MLHIGTFALPCQTDSNIPLVEIYKNIVTSPWPDLKNKGSDIKKSATMNPTPSFPFKGACQELSATLVFLGHEPPISLCEPEVNSRFHSLMF